MIHVRFRHQAPFEAMQFTHENWREFVNWASPRFGVSSYPRFMFDDDRNLVGGFVWLGRRGDDRDRRVELGEWCVDTRNGLYVLTPSGFEKWYERV